MGHRTLTSRRSAFLHRPKARLNPRASGSPPTRRSASIADTRRARRSRACSRRRPSQATLPRHRDRGASPCLHTRSRLHRAHCLREVSAGTPRLATIIGTSPPHSLPVRFFARSSADWTSSGPIFSTAENALRNFLNSFGCRITASSPESTGPGVFRGTRNTAGGTPTLPDAYRLARHDLQQLWMIHGARLASGFSDGRNGIPNLQGQTRLTCREFHGHRVRP